MPASQSIPTAEIHAAIERLAQAIAKHHGAKEKILLLGIANGGVTLARRLASRLSVLSPSLSLKSGTLDISFHRDDIGRNPIPKEFTPTLIPVDVTGATVILVDDVLFSGRTVKAALNELFDHGRPEKVELAILVDRGFRKLPVAADYTGLTLEASPTAKVVVKLDSAKPANDTLVVVPAKA
ncbi:MAG TPA: bifunctional pyr operon transcriptional regulator/uracil phosphoribosyltransferase PyrR [Rariglobus sp.]|nr:bifunctional pyr operon transcriptional regulator/uracil phosphoribosyltransferase PyrR [Rariglobus sp.]